MDDTPRRPKPKVFASDSEDTGKKRPKPQKFSNDNYGRYKRSQKHEDRISEALHGKRLPRSGGLSWSKWDKKKTAGGDLRNAEFLIEHKRTDNESMSIKKEWLAKVREGAASVLRDPAVIITFETAGSTKPPEDWILLPLNVFKRLAPKEDE
jgi:hypothetical protein